MFLSKQSPNQKDTLPTYTYDVMLTFDLTKDASGKYPEVKEELEKLGFKTNWLDFNSSRTENSVEDNYLLPETTFLFQVPGTNYDSKEELAIFLRDTLKKILNGKFVFLIDKAESKEINGYASEFCVENKD